MYWQTSRPTSHFLVGPQGNVSLTVPDELPPLDELLLLDEPPLLDVEPPLLLDDEPPAARCDDGASRGGRGATVAASDRKGEWKGVTNVANESDCTHDENSTEIREALDVLGTWRRRCCRTRAWPSLPTVQVSVLR